GARGDVRLRLQRRSEQMPAACVTIERHATQPLFVHFYPRAIFDGTQLHTIAQLDPPNPAVRECDRADLVDILSGIIAEPRRRLFFHQRRRERGRFGGAHATDRIDSVAIKPREHHAADGPQHQLHTDDKSEPLVKLAQERHQLDLSTRGRGRQKLKYSSHTPLAIVTVPSTVATRGTTPVGASRTP